MAIVQIVNEQPFAHNFTCRHCGSELIAEADDVKVGRFGANYGGDTPQREFYVTCPVCGTDHIIDELKVPPVIKQKLQEEGKG